MSDASDRPDPALDLPRPLPLPQSVGPGHRRAPRLRLFDLPLSFDVLVWGLVQQTCERLRASGIVDVPSAADAAAAAWRSLPFMVVNSVLSLGSYIAPRQAALLALQIAATSSMGLGARRRGLVALLMAANVQTVSPEVSRNTTHRPELSTIIPGRVKEYMTRHSTAQGGAAPSASSSSPTSTQPIFNAAGSRQLRQSRDGRRQRLRREAPAAVRGARPSQGGSVSLTLASANVQTLLPWQEDRAYARNALNQMLSKVEVLETTFQEHKLDVVGIQEGRARTVGSRVGAAYKQYRAAAV